jgi:hypothetical protein
MFVKILGALLAERAVTSRLLCQICVVLLLLFVVAFYMGTRI